MVRQAIVVSDSVSGAGDAQAKARVRRSAELTDVLAIHMPAASGGITIAISKQFGGNLVLSANTKIRHQRIFVL